LSKDIFDDVPSADFPSMYGNFRIYAFKEGEYEHLALVKGDPGGKERVPVRVHSQCLTGDTFGSKRCDCGLQLENALFYIGGMEYGIFIYLDQEGRGIGLFNKIKAYSLQDKGMDTVEANMELGFECDLRRYDIVADILEYFEVLSVEIMTNNPEKISGLEDKGITVAGRIPLVVTPNKFNQNYLNTKKSKMNHYIG